jgi:cytochrome c oxidase subunit 4
MAQAHHPAAEPHKEAHHPGAGVYIWVAAILAVVTLVELLIIYMPIGRAVMITILLALSAAKFYTVAMFFMHLRYDDKLFSIIFGGGIALTIGILTALFALFGIIK